MSKSYKESTTVHDGNPPGQLSPKSTSPSLPHQLRFHLQNLPNNLRRLLIRCEQLLTLLPLLLDSIILIEQLSKQILTIQFADQPVLHFIPTVIDEEMHDRLGDLIGNGLPHDVKIRRDEAADQFGFEGFALGEGGFSGLFGLDFGEEKRLVDGSYLIRIFING